MRHDPLPPLQSEAALPGLSFARIDAILRAEAKEHGLTLRSGHGRSTWCPVDGGEFGARQGAQGSILYVRAQSRDWLFTLQETMSAHLAEIEPAQAALIRWSALDRPGGVPPNFSLATVESVRPLGRHFLRLRLAGAGLDRFARDMIHFRLVLPPPGVTAPQWPVTGANGQTLWPDGAQALHRPAYTVSAIDAAAGWMETDIFLHEGGRTCDWANAVTAGTQIGLTGPGGGGVPVAARLLIGGDETAYPALARIIAAQGAGSSGECWLFGQADDYPLPPHPGIRITHAPMAEAALAAGLTRDGSDAERVWIATEKTRLAPLRRAILDDLAFAKTAAHLAAYWSASGS